MKNKIMENKTMKNQTLKHSQSSFTLIELLVVIVIIGILAGVLIVSFDKTTDTARDTRDKAQLASLRNTILAYGVSNNFTFPVSNPVRCNVGDSSNLGCADLATAIPNLPRPVSGNGYYGYISNGKGFILQATLSDNTLYTVNYTISTACPTGYIDSGYGFCVMQYEAKNVGGVATSQSGGTPWINITQPNAITTCSNLGLSYHLITNQEWVLLANDIVGVANNWTSGIVGQGLLVRGNSNGSAALDGSAPGTPQTTNYRIHTLTNGSSIWDLAGNVWEWTNDTCQSGTGFGKWYNIGSYIEWTDANLSDYEKSMAGPPGSYTSTQGMGRYGGCSANGNAFVRGGNFDHSSVAGAFALWLGTLPTSAGNRGFRCAR